MAYFFRNITFFFLLFCTLGAGAQNETNRKGGVPTVRKRVLDAHLSSRDKRIEKLMERQKELAEKVEEIKNKVGYSERTDAVIEPKLSMQWFLKMDEISKPALDAVLKGEPVAEKQYPSGGCNIKWKV